MSKANRQKGVVREKRQFVCWNHGTPFKGPIRFKHKEVWWDWSNHNKACHDKLPKLGITGEWVHEDENGKFIGGQETLVL